MNTLRWCETLTQKKQSFSFFVFASSCYKNHMPWTSWDDKLDSDVMTKIVDEQQKLAQGITTPDEFIKTCDSFVEK